MTSRSLIGTELDQVPVNGMLGGLAYQSSENAAIKNLNLKNIADIDKDIHDTAVDVFVYDTSKDSDGGAWRYRTKSTSWYNETLETSIRGNRKEFPAVAVLVLEGEKLTIYDGDDPDLPMWMIFSTNATDYYLISGYNDHDLRCLAALNGIIAVGNAPGYNHGGLIQVNFIKDDALATIHTANRSWTGGIINRNSDAYWKTLNNGEYIASNEVKDISMTVLPNTPIDPFTGLSTPTIAVGTKDGVSVIRSDGTAISTASSSSAYHIKKIAFTKDNGLNAHIDSSSSANKSIVYVDDFESINKLSYGTYANWDGVLHYTRYTDNVLTYLAPSAGSAFPISDVVSMNGRKAAVGSNFSAGGLTILEKEEKGGDMGQGMVAFASTSYNTGYMQGDIKGAFLSDTIAESVNPTNLVTEDFSANWTGATNGVLSVSNNRLTITNSGGNNGRAQSNTFATTSGKKYAFIVRGVAQTGGATFRSEVRGPELVGASPTAGALTLYFNGTGNSSTFVELYAIGANGASVTYEDAYIVELEEDRSVNDKGIQVFGTITKSPVETSADLVAYSGFSGTNVLRQSPNSDMNLGTSDAHIMAWYKTSGNPGGTLMVMAYEGGAAGTSDYGKPFNLRMVSGKITGWASHNNFSSWNAVYDSVDSNDGKWHCAVWVRSGSSFLLYKDGEGPISHWSGAGINEVQNDGVGNNALSDENTELVIGARKRGKAPGATDHEEPFDGSIALARIGKSAPSAEQIKKMYDEEKVLFQENAKCTLHGSSNAVTALAYDDSTNLLLVGTSSGRSDFFDLKRVDHSTLAVTTAISAHDGLIAQQ